MTRGGGQIGNLLGSSQAESSRSLSLCRGKPRRGKQKSETLDSALESFERWLLLECSSSVLVGTRANTAPAKGPRGQQTPGNTAGSCCSRFSLSLSLLLFFPFLERSFREFGFPKRVGMFSGMLVLSPFERVFWVNGLNIWSIPRGTLSMKFALLSDDFSLLPGYMRGFHGYIWRILFRVFLFFFFC